MPDLAVYHREPRGADEERFARQRRRTHDLQDVMLAGTCLLRKRRIRQTRGRRATLTGPKSRAL